MIHTKTGGWIANVETSLKIPFRRVSNTFYMDAWVKLPDKNKSNDKGTMDIDNVGSKKSGFIRLSGP